MTEPLPYRCEYGHMCQSRVDFATFAEALAFYRGYMASRVQSFPSVAHAKYGCPIRLVNIDNIDGADDAKPWAQAGLTEDEWEQIENL